MVILSGARRRYSSTWYTRWRSPPCFS
jgi:hypothetical protein